MSFGFKSCVILKTLKIRVKLTKPSTRSKFELLRKKNDNLEESKKEIAEENTKLQSENKNLKKKLEDIRKTNHQDSTRSGSPYDI